MTAPSVAPPAIRVSTVGPGAAEAACHVVRQSIAGCCALDHRNDPAILTAWLANKTPENLAAWMAAPGAVAWGAYRLDGGMVGFALLTHTTLALCYVLPEALHQGVGRALLNEAEAGARRAGVDGLGLESTRTAQAFYLRNGYEAVGAVRTWAGLQAQPMRKAL